MTVRTLTLVVCLLAAGAWVVAQEVLPGGAAPDAAAPPTDARHHSYAIGIDIGTSFRRDGLELDVDRFVAGLRDGLAGAEREYSEELCGLAMQRLSEQRAENIRKQSEEFLVQNAKGDGVFRLPSGLQYKVLKSGPGAGRSPRPTDSVRVHYVGRLIDGTIFDQTGGEPAEFVVQEVIQGWTEALQRMKIGDKWELVLPAELAYKDAGAGDVIPPNATLIFEVELVTILQR
jgi:FKBP-type peptidyl-prolyl cis-trans isomerase